METLALRMILSELDSINRKILSKIQEKSFGNKNQTVCL
jgi:hypothetical protein